MTPQERERHAAHMRLRGVPHQIARAKRMQKSRREQELQRIYTQTQADYALIGKRENTCPPAHTSENPVQPSLF
jgi:hypothetical protein